MQTSPKTKLTPKTQLTPKTTLTPKKKATPEKKAAPESSSVCPDAMPQVGRDDASHAAMCLQELPAAIRDYVGIGRYRSADPAILKEKMIKVWFCCCGADPAFKKIPASELTDSQIAGVQWVPATLLPEHEQGFSILMNEIRALTFPLQEGRRPSPADLDRLEWLAVAVELVGGVKRSVVMATATADGVEASPVESNDCIPTATADGVEASPVESNDCIPAATADGVEASPVESNDWIPLNSIRDVNLRRSVWRAASGQLRTRSMKICSRSGVKWVLASEVLAHFTPVVAEIVRRGNSASLLPPRLLYAFHGAGSA